jgi:hypothetical protein
VNAASLILKVQRTSGDPQRVISAMREEAKTEFSDRVRNL